MSPGLNTKEYQAVTSKPPPEIGQWSYDFSDPTGPQMGTIAFLGSSILATCMDPVAIISEHSSLNIPIPPSIHGEVDLAVLVDRGMTSFAERRFLVYDFPEKDGDDGVTIEAFQLKRICQRIVGFWVRL
mmetsp:Transcript_18863/g.26560  ORF Transcript_18863/g.26560 Transcript_18863/m.26560 type:complete len:129 (+) Transcript_18863:112-498(+)